MRSILNLLIAGVLLSCVGCADSTPASLDVSSSIRNVVQDDASQNIQSFYNKRSYEPAFVNASMGTREIRSAVSLLCRANQQGLNPADYVSDTLRQSIERAYADEVESDSILARRLAELDVELAAALMEYASDVISGRVNPKEFGPAWQTPVHHIDPASVLAEEVTDTSIQDLPGRVAAAHKEYGELVDALERYRDVAQKGGWPTVSAGEPLAEGDSSARVQTVVRRLAATGDLDSMMLSDSTFQYTGPIADAVRTFQQRHGLEQDGVVGENVIQAMNVSASERVRQLELNLERWRWIPSQLGGKYLYVNVPAFELHAFEDGSEKLSMPVVVGKEYNDRATPVFSDTMEYVVFNPYWNIPRSIAEEEILPNARDDASFLARNDYEIVTGWGEGADVVPATSANMDMVAGGRYRLRQEPGPENSLGQIKFMFPNDFDIYLHDTPAQHLFEKAERAFSHGCIRVAEPVELGEFVFTSEQWDADRIRNQIQSRERSVEYLESPVPVYILYWTAFVDPEGRVNFREDLYGNDEALDQALARQAPGQRSVSCKSLLAPLRKGEES